MSSSHFSLVGSTTQITLRNEGEFKLWSTWHHYNKLPFNRSQTFIALIYCATIIWAVTARKKEVQDDDLQADGTFIFKKLFKNSLVASGYPLIGYFPNNFIPYGILFPSAGQLGYGYYF